MDNPDDIKEWRKTQCADPLLKRLAIKKMQRRRGSARVTQLLTEGFPILCSKIVRFFWPFQGQFDPRFAIHQIRKHGATVALPVVSRKGSPLQFREWRPGVRVSKGVFDLPVPEGIAVVRPQAMLISPVGFDSRGYRLGYGGGYFDQTFAILRSQPLKIGMASELFRIAKIQPQPYDVPMEFIVTEPGIHYVSRDGLVCLRDPGETIELSGRIMRNRDCSANQSEKSTGLLES